MATHPLLVGNGLSHGSEEEEEAAMVGAGSGECSGVERGEVVVSESDVSRVVEERGGS